MMGYRSKCFRSVKCGSDKQSNITCREQKKENIVVELITCCNGPNSFRSCLVNLFGCLHPLQVVGVSCLQPISLFSSSWQFNLSCSRKNETPAWPISLHFGKKDPSWREKRRWKLTDRNGFKEDQVMTSCHLSPHFAPEQPTEIEMRITLWRQHIRLCFFGNWQRPPRKPFHKKTRHHLRHFTNQQPYSTCTPKCT